MTNLHENDGISSTFVRKSRFSKFQGGFQTKGKKSKFTYNDKKENKKIKKMTRFKGDRKERKDT